MNSYELNQRLTSMEERLTELEGDSVMISAKLDKVTECLVELSQYSNNSDQGLGNDVLRLHGEIEELKSKTLRAVK